VPAAEEGPLKVGDPETLIPGPINALLKVAASSLGVTTTPPTAGHATRRAAVVATTKIDVLINGSPSAYEISMEHDPSVNIMTLLPNILIARLLSIT